MRICYEALGVSLGKTILGADLGGSAKYSIDSFEDRNGEGVHVNNSRGQPIPVGIWNLVSNFAQVKPHCWMSVWLCFLFLPAKGEEIEGGT